MKKFLLAALGFAILISGCKDGSKSRESDDAESQRSNSSQNEEFANALIKTKVQSSIGDVTRLKGGVGDVWKQLRIGQMVVENDRVKTLIESEAKLGVVDGSILVISENSDVTLSAHREDQDAFVYLVSIGEGKVYFDIQKQKHASFKFKTGSVGAAIRGTAGFIGSVGGKTVASLKEGVVDVTNNKGEVHQIVENETILVDSLGNTKKMKLASSGTEYLAKAMDSVIQTATAGIASVETLEQAVKAFDSSYAQRQKSFEKTLRFQASRVADTTYVPSVTLQARVTPGVVVSVLGEKDTVGANGIYQKSFEWGDDAYGTKRFLASCGDGTVEVPCYMWITEYVAPVGLMDSSFADSTAVDSVAQDSIVADSSADKVYKDVNLSVKLGSRNERVHLDLPATKYQTNLKIDLAGIGRNELENLSSITVLRGGKVVRTIREKDLTSLSYEVPIEINRNKIADFEVVVAGKNGKNYRARKTYEVYCLVSNHPGGLARNSVLSQDQEYQRLVQSGGLTRE